MSWKYLQKSKNKPPPNCYISLSLPNKYALYNAEKFTSFSNDTNNTFKLYSSRNSIWVVTLGWRWLTVGTPCCVCFSVLFCFIRTQERCGHAQASSQQLRSGSPFRRILRQFWKKNCDDSLELPTNLKIDQSCILLRNASQNHRR